MSNIDRLAHIINEKLKPKSEAEFSYILDKLLSIIFEGVEDHT